MFQHIALQPLHATFAAQVTGVDFSRPVPDEVCNEIKQAVHQHGVLVFRETNLDDESHIAFAAKFGPLDSMKLPTSAGVKMRIAKAELTDQSNIEVDGTIIDPNSPRGQFNKGNLLFHVDNSYNPQRASYSILRAADVPSHENHPTEEVGGNTEFADTRQAWDDLPEAAKAELLSHDYEAWHSVWHSRKQGSPSFFARVDPALYPMARRPLVQLHAPSGRRNMYVPSHCHGIEGLGADESRAKLDSLFAHATQGKYVVSVPWEKPGDVIMWDNRAVMHRGTPMVGVYRRDMRRATVLDEGPDAASLNEIDVAASWRAMFDVAKLYEVAPPPVVANQEVAT